MKIRSSNILKPRLRGLIRIAPGETRCKLIFCSYSTAEWLNLQITSIHSKIQPLRGCRERIDTSHRVSPDAIHIEPLRGFLQYFTWINMLNNPTLNSHI